VDTAHQELMDAPNLFELTWIQPQPSNLKIVKYVHDLWPLKSAGKSWGRLGRK